MALVTGNQLKAARALAGLDQQAVAAAADVNVNTIRNMEACASGPITSSAVTVRRVQVALEGHGVEFLNHGQPGVRLGSPQSPAEAPRTRPAEKQAGSGSKAAKRARRASKGR